MIRTQIQLPAALYAQAKQIAKRHEISLAELVRRGLEHMLTLYPIDEKPPEGWALPGPFPLGEFKVPVDRWREVANAPRDSPEDPE